LIELAAFDERLGLGDGAGGAGVVAQGAAAGAAEGVGAACAGAAGRAVLVGHRSTRIPMASVDATSCRLTVSAR
ncbi:MAG: hypothetical protein EPO22_11570, partial [Dehalococcoidia bacterium]